MLKPVMKSLSSKFAPQNTDLSIESQGPGNLRQKHTSTLVSVALQGTARDCTTFEGSFSGHHAIDAYLIRFPNLY